jgi:CRP-like cAMP-binding protein
LIALKENYFCFMNTVDLLASINRHITLTEEESSYFLSLMLPLHVRQHEMIEKPGEPAKYFIYVGTGCLMSYYTDKEGTDHVMQFAQAGWWTGDLPGYTQQLPATYATRALTDCDLLLLPKAGMDQLLDKHIKFERYFRILFQNSLIAHQSRLAQNLSFTAEERYVAFQKKFPSLEQFVPLKYIASYLGMTPEFLSKIRRKLTTR